jgi:hypothetical protein
VGRWRTIRDALTNRLWTRDITGAPTAAVLHEYVILWDALEFFHLAPHTADRFV